MRKFDSSRAVADARSISYPRLVGTPEEVKARQSLANKLTEIGLQPRQEPFAFYPLLAFGILKNTVLIGLAMLVAYRILLSGWPRLGAVLGLALPLIANYLWGAYRRAASAKLEDNADKHPWQSRLIDDVHMKFETANIIADLPVQGEVKHRLVLSAHTDSKSQNMSISTRMVCSALFAIGVFVLPFATLPGLFWPAWLTGTTGAIWWAFFLLAVFGGVVVHTLEVTNESPGALDNAGSCALIVETARTLTAEPPQGVAVRVLLTGAEELGLAGGYAYARAAKDDPDWKDAIHLNFEAVGGNTKLFYTTETGPTGSHAQTGKKATDLLLAACAKAGVKPKRLGKVVGGEADHMPLVEAGLSAVTLMFSGSDTLTIHTAADKPELIREESMALAGKIVLAAVEELEKG